MKKITSIVVLLALSAIALMAQQGLVASHQPTTAAVPTTVAPPSAADLGKPVARVNGVVLTEREVREQMQRLFPYYAMHGGKVPEKYAPEIRQKAVRQLVIDELVYQAAKRRGMTVAPATMRNVLRQAKSRFKSAAEYQQFARAQYGSVAEFEKRIRRAVLIAQYQRAEVDLKSKVSEAQVRGIYDKNKRAFFRPESVWLQTISIMLPENPSPEQRRMARTRIEELLPKAKATKNFEEFGVLAESASEDDYRVMMGDNKWVHTVGLEPEVEKIIKALQPGQVSGIVETRTSYVIFRANERRPEKQMAYSEIRNKLREQLEEASRKHRWEIVQQQLRKAAHIEML